MIKRLNGDIMEYSKRVLVDAIKFYNLLEKYIRKEKIKQVFFIGDFSVISKQRKKLEDEIMELTGWNRKRVQMKNTSYYTK